MKPFAFLFLLFPICLFAQPNCNAYLYMGDTLRYRACIEAEKADGYYQFQREFQEILDSSIRICPYFAYAYKTKSIAYLKCGDFITWKKLIDKAVQYDAEGNLGYRGWCRFQFFRDYKGAIRDIEMLDSLLNGDIGYSVNGDYHLNMAKGMCYSAIGQKEKAIEIFDGQLNTTDYSAGLYDYYQLGVTYYETGDYKNALKAFDRQSEINELADNAYRKSIIYKKLDNDGEYKKHRETALKLFRENRRMFDPYTHHFNCVYPESVFDEQEDCPKIGRTNLLKRLRELPGRNLIERRTAVEGERVHRHFAHAD